MTAELPPLRDIISRFGLDARKRFGLHFLLDLNLTARIARSAGDLSNCTVIEVGPGPGGLTRALLEAGARQVIAIERDPRCVEAMEDLSQYFEGRLMVIDADAMELDISSLAKGPKKIVANLPYNVATPLLIGWLHQIACYESLTLMFQKEVADRLTANPGNKTYGRLSVLTQWLCHTTHDFNIARTAFTPPPKVESTVVTLTPRPAPLAECNWQALEQVTAAAFGQRRKMLRASLKSLNADLGKIGIDPTARAETLSPEQFCAIARLIE